MFNNNRVAKAIRLALVLGASSAVISAPVFAEEAGAEAIEKIQVTGSRISRSDIETPIPVTIIGRADILAMGALNVADILNSTPVAIAGSDQSNSAFTTSSVGVQTTQLRGLGDSRTLVLVNGRRFVSGISPSSGYAVDLNAIPTSMIERVEILKSASSAIYGSDAVAGVINIITRSDFQGVEVNAQAGISAESDRKKHSISITAGNTWDTGNASIAVGFDVDEGLKSSDRAFSAYDQAVFLDLDGKEYIGNLFSSYPPQGHVIGDSNRPDYNGDGTLYDGASDGFNRADYRQLITPLDRKYVAMNLRQELFSNVEFFVEANYNNSTTNGSTIEPFGLNTNSIYIPERGGTGGISMTNPMIPDLLYDNLIANGLTDADNIPAMSRRLVEFGPRSTDLQRDTIRVVQGIDWDINDNWMFNTYVSWGKTDQTQNNGGQINIERAALALDVEVNADGDFQCVDQLARLQGCAPLDLFSAGSISDAAVAYVGSPAKVTGTAEQLVFAATVTGELPFTLSGGNIATAFGLEHRNEKGVHNPGDLAQTGASSTNKSAPTDGEFSTDDIFAEVVLPILDNLAVNLAARYSDHSITGGDTTWNASIEYSPIETLKLRASAATAIRTPNIGNLFGGRGETFSGVTDPCSGLTASDTSQAAVNCLSIQEIADRVEADGAFNLTQVELQSTGGTIGGSEDVNVETADSMSFGFVWEITDGLSMTLDYYDIEIEDAISTTSRSTVLKRCFNVDPSDFDPSCAGQSVRDSNGALTEVHSGTGNENDIATSGIDLEVSYSVDLGPGVFTTDFLWNHTNEYIYTSIESGESVDYVGEVTTPDDRANLNLAYTMDDWSFSWRMRYWGESVDSIQEFNRNMTNYEPLTDFNDFDAVLYHDITATYFVNENTDVTLGIRNLLDEDPQFAGQGSNSGGTGINTVSEAYDVTGQYLNASITVRF